MLTITPKIADKTARFKGAVAAGEHVAVTIKGGAAWLGDDNGAHLTLRVLDLVTGRTLAVFPRPEETYGEDDEYVPDEWSTSAEDPNDLFCNLNLNTDRMVNAARHMLRVPVLFVMGSKDDANPATTRTLYFRDRHEVEFWPERVGDDTPYDLDKWPKQIDEWTELIAEFETRIDAAEDSIRDAVDEANGIVAHVDAAKTAAQSSATAAGDSASSAQGSAATAKNWATGGGETGDPGATNNAKYYAQQAGASATSAEASATAAAGSATAAANSATAASGSATSAASSAQSAAGAAEAAVETEKERAEGAENNLADAIDAEKERAEGAEALAIVNAEYNSTSRRIVFTTGGDETKTIDASAFIKDGMISSVSVSNGNLVITFNSDAGKQPISIPLTQIFNPSNYYDKTAADGRFVKKDGAKVLSTNDYTTAEKQKLAGIANGANNYTLPPATSSVLGGVKQGTGCTIELDGTLNVTGGSGTVDDTVTRTSTNPVKSSGIWSAIWGALTALPTGFTALYDWVVAQLAGKLNTDGYTSWSISYPVSGYELLSCRWNRRGFEGVWVVELLNVASGEKETFNVPEAKTITEIVGPSEDPMHPPFRLVREKMCKTKTSELTNDGDGDSPFATVSQIPDISGKADAADLRYRIAEAVRTAKLPASAFPIEYTDSTATPTSRTITSADDVVLAYCEQASDAIIAYDKNNPDYAGSFGFATFNATTGEFDSKDAVITSLSFNGSATATLDFVYLVADRAVNLITATDETSIDIELPEAVTVDGVRRARDFILDVDNSAGASDIGLELASDATAYLDAGGAHYLVAVADGDDLADLLTVAAGKRARLYFTETAQTATPTGSTSAVPVISLQRLTVTVGGAA